MSSTEEARVRTVRTPMDGIPPWVFGARDWASYELNRAGVFGDIGIVMEAVATAARVNLVVWVSEACRVQGILRKERKRAEAAEALLSEFHDAVHLSDPILAPAELCRRYDAHFAAHKAERDGEAG